MDLAILDYILFDGVTVKHVIAAVVVLVVLFWVAPKLFGKKEELDVYENIRCLECGWTGKVSKYHRTCRKCNGTALEKLG